MIRPHALKRWKAAGLLLAAVGVLAGCAPRAGGGPSAQIIVDGSSTVFPVVERLAELYSIKNPEVRLTVSQSGTGGGMKRFSKGEVDIATASRTIKPDEVETLRAAGIDFVEVPIAYDGLSVVINRENDWAQTMTVEELRKLWQDDTVQLWSDIRPEWPRQKINLFGPGTDSGTFLYFTEAVVGEERKSRGDFMASEDDNVLIAGVMQDRYGLVYLGFSYYYANKDQLRSVALDHGDGVPVPPTMETIADGTYRLLSRPLILYVSTKALERPDVLSFVEFMLTEGKASLREIGFVPLPDEAYELALQRVRERKVGTVLHGAQPGIPIQDLLRQAAAQSTPAAQTPAN